MEFKEVVERLEKAFLEFDVSYIGRVIVEDAKDHGKPRNAWKILIAEPRANMEVENGK